MSENAVEEEECECPAGIPAWVMTFADLMSLLMCFFVLLLSFSEMDVQKFKQLMGSVQFAFGVQTEIEAKSIPKGTSIIAQEFSPGTPRPSSLRVIQQQTTMSERNTLEIPEPTSESTPKVAQQASAEDSADGLPEPIDGASDIPTDSDESLERASDAANTAPMDIDPEFKQDDDVDRGGVERQLVLQTESDAQAIEENLREEIRDGLVDVTTEGRKIIINIRERASFDSGRADINPRFIPVLRKVRNLLAVTPGLVRVEGHTDGRSSTGPFRSSLELSAMRANSVAGELLAGGVLNTNRFSVVGMGAAAPKALGFAPAALAQNRRVEIIIDQGIGPADISGAPISVQEQDQGDVRLRSRFSLENNELF